MALRFLFAAIVLLVPAGGHALAEGAAARGARVVEQWCRMCHLHADDAADPDMAPPFEEIAGLEGRDEAYFTEFLGQDHFPMPIYRLFDDEKADVVAYLMELRRRASAR